MLPKTIAATFAERVAYMVSPSISLLVKILTPMTALLGTVHKYFHSHHFKRSGNGSDAYEGRPRSMVDIASIEGTFEQEESNRLKEVLDFPEKDVSDVLETHRTDIIGLPIEATYEEVRDTILEHSYTRYPVYEESMDTILGVFYSKMLIEWSMDPETDTW